MPKPGTPEYREHIKQACERSQMNPMQRLATDILNPANIEAARKFLAERSNGQG